ncbi:MAG: hypothetical protein J5441_00645 [Clostridia bacterium]|nr:hypothetical protein [Clostridia bacterium]
MILLVAVILLAAVVGLAVFAGGKEAGETGSVKMIKWSSDGFSGYMPDIQSSASTLSEAPADPPAPSFPDTPADVAEDEGELAMSPDVYPYMLVNYKYTEKLESFGSFWDYVIEQTGETLDTMFKTVWRYKYGTSFNLLDLIDEFNISKEEFVELYKRAGFDRIELTDEEIDIIYSGDKKRIAEAFTQPYAIVTGDWEVYPLRWIIDNPAELYKEKGISFEALETVVNNLLERERIYDEDRDALILRIAEYKKLQ